MAAEALRKGCGSVASRAPGAVDGGLGVANDALIFAGQVPEGHNGDDGAGDQEGFCPLPSHGRGVVLDEAVDIDLELAGEGGGAGGIEGQKFPVIARRAEGMPGRKAPYTIQDAGDEEAEPEEDFDPDAARCGLVIGDNGAAGGAKAEIWIANEGSWRRRTRRRSAVAGATRVAARRNWVGIGSRLGRLRGVEKGGFEAAMGAWNGLADGVGIEFQEPGTVVAGTGD